MRFGQLEGGGGAAAVLAGLAQARGTVSAGSRSIARPPGATTDFVAMSRRRPTSTGLAELHRSRRKAGTPVIRVGRAVIVSASSPTGELLLVVQRDAAQ